MIKKKKKNAKPQRSPWTVRINFHFPLIRTQMVMSLLSSMDWSSASPAFGCIPKENGHTTSRRPQGSVQGARNVSSILWLQLPVCPSPAPHSDPGFVPTTDTFGVL